MSEYWVSTSKYHCKYCNTWMADNKPSRQNHDNSIKHKSNLQMYHKKKNEEKLHGLRNENELKKQLDEINKAANSALQNDIISHGHLFHQSSNTTINNSLKVNINIPNNNKSLPYSNQINIESNEETKEKDNGFYTIKGQGYLEGSLYEHLLLTNVTCQIFVEEMDEWVNAIILGRKEVSVPHTALTIKTFSLEYKSNDNQTINENNVKSDRIRLFATSDGIPTHVDGTTIKAINSETVNVKPIIDETTGIGKWQTVSIKLVNEEEIKRQKEIEEEKDKKKKLEDKIVKEQVSRLENTINRQDNDILAAMDPYGTNVYKGIKIVTNAPAPIDSEESILTKGSIVSFNKRKSDEKISIKFENSNKKRSIRKVLDDNE